MSCIGAGVNYLHWREQKQERHICIKIVLNKPLQILHNSILIVNKVPLLKKKKNATLLNSELRQFQTLTTDDDLHI